MKTSLTKTLLRSLLLCLPVAAVLAQPPPRDLEPVLLGRSVPYPPVGVAGDVAVEGDRVYCTLQMGGLAIYEVQNAAPARWVGQITEPTHKVTVRDRVAYCLTWQWGRYTELEPAPALLVYNVADPAQPRRLARVQLPAWGTSVAVAGNLACVALGKEEAILLVNISDPARPEVASRFQMGAFAGEVALIAGYAYVAARGTALLAVNVTNPSEPKRAGEYKTASGTWRFAVSARHAFVPQSVWDEQAKVWRYSLLILDLIDPTNLRRLGVWELEQHVVALAVTGQRLLYTTANELRILDISDPANPRQRGSVGHNLQGWISGMTAAGNAAYLTGGDFWQGVNGLRVFEITDVDHPVAAGPPVVATLGTPRDLVVVGDRAYLAEGAMGLQIIDVSDPANTRRLGGHPTQGVAERVVVNGNVACVWGSGPVGEAFDVSDPSAIKRLSGEVCTDAPSDQAVIGGYAYVSNSGCWEVVDISDPARPQVIGGCLPVGGSRIAVANNRAFMGGGWSHTIEALDVSNPAAPVLVGQLATFAAGTALAAAGDRV